jgi:DNA-binding NtrC family response regulator
MPWPILIVEDDDQVRDFTVMVLKREHDVRTATSVTDARTAVDAHPAGAPLCLVVDMVLNRQSGLAFAQELVKRRPECRVLLISGFTDGVVMTHPDGDSRMGFLPKPFTGPQLTAAVAAICA